MPNRRLRIMQIFNRYQEYGGEEGSVFRIGDALQRIHDVEYFLSSTAEMTSGGLFRNLMMPWMALHNPEVLRKLKRYQNLGRFDAWQIHNIFPVMSPVVYERALDWKIPIVHFLHNYRFGCVNGFFLNHGKPCQRCISGNFWAAFTTACWHDSHAKSGWMGMITAHVRKMPLFEKVFQWIAISEAQKQVHIQMGIPEENIRVIHHFLESDAPPLARSNSSTAIFVGRLSAEKGVDKLIEAWRLIAGGERELLIVGDGPERVRLEKQALGLKGIRFTGFTQRNAQQRYWQSALFSVVPSIWLEPFGMTVLEAWSKGRPVIGHNIGALPELIQDNVSGLLTDPHQVSNLAEKMDCLFSNPEKAHAMGYAGYDHLKTKFSLKVWLSQMIKLYDGLR